MCVYIQEKQRDRERATENLHGSVRNIQSTIQESLGGAPGSGTVPCQANGGVEASQLNGQRNAPGSGSTCPPSQLKAPGSGTGPRQANGGAVQHTQAAVAVYIYTYVYLYHSYICI